eukprot:scaffold1768_cov116-Isochrysis_galbana.AAC.1
MPVGVRWGNRTQRCLASLHVWRAGADSVAPPHPPQPTSVSARERAQGRRHHESPRMRKLFPRRKGQHISKAQGHAKTCRTFATTQAGYLSPLGNAPQWPPAGQQPLDRARSIAHLPPVVYDSQPLQPPCRRPPRGPTGHWWRPGHPSCARTPASLDSSWPRCNSPDPHHRVAQPQKKRARMPFRRVDTPERAGGLRCEHPIRKGGRLHACIRGSSRRKSACSAQSHRAVSTASPKRCTSGATPVPTLPLRDASTRLMTPALANQRAVTRPRPPFPPVSNCVPFKARCSSPRSRKGRSLGANRSEWCILTSSSSSITTALSWTAE